jgi:DNA-binding protein HU-beta
MEAGESVGTLAWSGRRLSRAEMGPLAQRQGGQKKEGHMNKLELVAHVAKESELSKVAAANAIESFIGGVTKALKKGDDVRLVGFGTFSVRKRAASKGRNPATGKEIKIAASKNARFKAGASLKALLNKAK